MKGRAPDTAPACVWALRTDDGGQAGVGRIWSLMCDRHAHADGGEHGALGEADGVDDHRVSLSDRIAAEGFHRAAPNYVSASDASEMNAAMNHLFAVYGDIRSDMASIDLTEGETAARKRRLAGGQEPGMAKPVSQSFE